MGENNDYEPERCAGVLELVREKSNWKSRRPNVHRGVSSYFCHNSYVVEVLDIEIQNNKPLFPPIFAALANSLYKATGKRLYDQPFQLGLELESVKI